MSDSALFHKLALTNQYVFFYIFNSIVSLGIWSYYSILLLRASNNAIEVVFMNLGITAVGVILGFALAGRLFNHLGYLNLFRLGNFTNLICFLLIYLTLHHILEVHLIFAVVRGLAVGFFWTPAHAFNTREVSGNTRAELISRMYSIDEILTVFIPTLVGGMLSVYGYDWLFLAGALLASICVIYPWKYNKIPRSGLELSDMRGITKQRGFLPWASYMIGEEILLNLRDLSLIVLPFLLIGQELGVGLLLSGIGLVGALLAFWRRHDDDFHKREWGYVGAMMVTSSSLLFLFVWDIPTLIIRSVVSRIGFAFHTPVQQNYSYRIKEMMLGNFRDQYIVEVQEYSELFLFIARMFNLIVLSVIFFVLQIDHMTILKGMFAISLAREIFFLFIAEKLVNKFKR